MNQQTNIKRNTTLAISGLLTLLIITITSSFAYFTANISGEETGTTITTTGGTMNINYSGGGLPHRVIFLPRNHSFSVCTRMVTSETIL